jgi:uncharacterized protein (DUF2164 family)
MNDEQKQALLKQISQFMQEEHDIEIGNIAAENILNFIKNRIEAEIHNTAIREAVKIVVKQSDNMASDIDALLKQ